MNPLTIPLPQGGVPKSVAHRAWAKLASGNMESVADECSDDVVWQMMGLETLLPNGGRYVGNAAVREFMKMGPQLYVFSKMVVDISATYVCGETVIMEFGFDTPVTNGRHYKANYIIVMKVVDGKICDVHEYADSLKVKTCLIDP